MRSARETYFQFVSRPLVFPKSRLDSPQLRCLASTYLWASSFSTFCSIGPRTSTKRAWTLTHCWVMRSFSNSVDNGATGAGDPRNNLVSHFVETAEIHETSFRGHSVPSIRCC